MRILNWLASSALALLLLANTTIAQSTCLPPILIDDFNSTTRNALGGAVGGGGLTQSAANNTVTISAGSGNFYFSVFTPNDTCFNTGLYSIISFTVSASANNAKFDFGFDYFDDTCTTKIDTVYPGGVRANTTAVEYRFSLAGINSIIRSRLKAYLLFFDAGVTYQISNMRLEVDPADCPEDGFSQPKPPSAFRNFDQARGHFRNRQQNFISRTGTQLRDGTDPFRFVSMNVPNLHFVEDRLTKVTPCPTILIDNFASTSVNSLGGGVGGGDLTLSAANNVLTVNVVGGGNYYFSNLAAPNTGCWGKSDYVFIKFKASASVANAKFGFGFDVYDDGCSRIETTIYPGGLQIGTNMTEYTFSLANVDPNIRRKFKAMLLFFDAGVTYQISDLRFAPASSCQTADKVWVTPDPYEQDDAIKSISGLGGQVTRMFTLGAGPEYHITDVRTYNETNFVAIDHALAAAARYGVRIIIPLLNGNSDPTIYGSYAAFTALRNKSAEAFFTDPELKEDFKHLISFLLNRRNSVNGRIYKDDPAVFCWQIGNEFGGFFGTPPPAQWTLEIAAHIKSVDPNHLVMDGMIAGLDQSRWPIEVLQSPLVDIMTNHYYFGISDITTGRFSSHSEYIKSFGKPYIIGEFGFANLQVYRQLIEGIFDQGIAGALIWSLRFHSYTGGFYIHNEFDDWYSYHVPGFPAYNPGFMAEEQPVITLLRKCAFAAQGITPQPKFTIPDVPTILSSSNSSNIVWQGSAWAASYDIYRRNFGRGGPNNGNDGEEVEQLGNGWELVGEDVSDGRPMGTVLFADSTAVGGERYQYRVRAKNIAGASGFSKALNLV
ncbi:hypothetical protein HK102_002162 [Quaeritorhiza haematococci]|nr:hypothetical protein HK102_002162 [Quaeritorhiza haematococci]